MTLKIKIKKNRTWELATRSINFPLIDWNNKMKGKIFDITENGNIIKEVVIEG